ncbi:MAG: DinB family protein [Balneolaceae bacterium]|nr:DinB family protein [Balneolaceae bacterium]
MTIEKSEYGSFYEGYIRYSNGKDLFDLLKTNENEMLLLMGTLTEDQAEYSYSDGKWSVKDVIGHITDTERIFCYRTLALARGERNPLPGYDHDAYVKTAEFKRYSVNVLKEHYQATRTATLSLFRSFTMAEMLKNGIVNEVNFTVRALGYIIAGHEIHHLKILEEKYLPALE